MFEFLTNFANFATLKLGFDLHSRAGASLSFFIEDTIKIFLLIYVMLFVVSLFRAQLRPEKIKEYLSGKSRFWGYILAVFLGVVTPFCSCSSIPLFITFVAAGVPFSMAMTFLVASPLISEIAAVMLLAMPEAGFKVALVYVLVGSLIAILAGILCDKFKLEKYIKPLQAEKKCSCEKNEDCHSHNHDKQDKIQSTIQFAHNYSFETVKEIWVYVLIGLGIGALMHGYVPQEFFVKYLGAENIFAVPLAAFAGIPIYANHNSVLPIVQVLLMKGVPVGTTLVMLMSITAISLPELIMLNKVLSWKILMMFVGFLFISFIFVGYLINWIM